MNPQNAGMWVGDFFGKRDVANINEHKVLISAIKDDRVIKINIINDKDNVKIIHDDFEEDNGGIKSTDIKITNVTFSFFTINNYSINI